MKLSVALLAAASAASAFTINNNGVRSATQLNARQPIVSTNISLTDSSACFFFNVKSSLSFIFRWLGIGRCVSKTDACSLAYWARKLIFRNNLPVR